MRNRGSRVTWLALVIGGCGALPDLRDPCDRNDLRRCDDPACARHCDSDGDGYIDARLPGGTDCDDDDPQVHPDAPELCNGRDDDCDGLIDDDDPDIERDEAPGVRVAQAVDADGDGVGTDTWVVMCPGAPGFAPVAGDCDDDDPRVAPGFPEVCDGVDNDCDGLIDAMDPSLEGGVVVFQDRDGDGHGNPSVARYGCVEPGWSADALDCDDTRATVHVGAPEICDGLDNDCDGIMGPEEIDADGDGDPVCTDCDDNDPSRSSRHEEVCGPPHGIDEDCDGLVDEDDPSLNLYTCGYCPSTGQPFGVPYHRETWNPCVLDPQTEVLCSSDPVGDPESHTEGQRLHRVRWRLDQGFWRPDLLLFLPPGPGRENQKILDWAAYAGYRTISLGYPNDDTIEALCDHDQASACYRDIMYERTYGVDLSAAVDIGPADAIVTRLSTLLEHLSIVHPDMGFDRYLRPDGTPEWSRIVVTGWSGGGGHAGFLSKYEPVAATILMSAPKDHDLDIFPVDWVSAPGVTPGCAMLTTWHTGEPFTEPPVRILDRAWDLMGIPDRRFDIDRNPQQPIPPGTTRISQSTRELPMGCSPHGSVGRDVCLRNEVFPAYVYLMCTAATLDPQTCEDEEATGARTGR